MSFNKIRYDNNLIFAPKFGQGYVQQVEIGSDIYYLWDESNVFKKRSFTEAVGSVVQSFVMSTSETDADFNNTILTLKSEKLGRYIALHNYLDPSQDLISAITNTLERNDGEKTHENARLLLFLYLLNDDLSAVVNGYDVDRFYDVSLSDKVFRTGKESTKEKSVRSDFFRPIIDRIHKVLEKHVTSLIRAIDHIDYYYHEIADFSVPEFATQLGLEYFWKKSILMEHPNYNGYDNGSTQNIDSTGLSQLSSEAFTPPQPEKNIYDDIFDQGNDEPPQEKPLNDYENLFE